MTHSYRVHYFHLVWSTKNRQPLIIPEIQSDLYAYMGGIIRNYNGKLLEIGGMPDHVHLLVQLSNLDKYSYFLRDIMSFSTLWVKKKYPHIRDFAWQEGFGSITVSDSLVEKMGRYIQNQAKHHEKMSFEDEYLMLLKHHGVEFDERFVFG